MTIIRTSTQVKGGITDAEKARMAEHSKLWISRAFRTEPTDRVELTKAIKDLYAAANLKEPRVVIVESPIVMAAAYGAAAAIWYTRKNAATNAATDDATFDATDAATYAATDSAAGDATWSATFDATHSATLDATDEATYTATRAATLNATIDATIDATWSATWSATFDAATDAATRDATYTATDAATRSATDAATRDTIWSATFDATDDAIYTATRAVTHNATWSATFAATYAATRAVTHNATYAATRAVIHNATYAATRAVTHNATWSATFDATDAATRAAIYDVTASVTWSATTSAIDEATYTATDVVTWSATRAATDEATYTATRSATDAETDAATRAATWSATISATDAVTWSATRAATDEATDEATASAMLACKELAGVFGLECAKRWNRVYQGGAYWASWACYLSAYRDVLGLRLPEYKAYDAWERAAIYGTFRVMHEEFCIVCDFPAEIHVDEQNRPHCETGPSHLWRDGVAWYHWHGVRVPSHWIENRKNLAAAEVLQEQNVEVRMAGCQILGWVKVAEQLDRKIIDGDPNTDIGALVELTLPGLPEPGRFLMAQCPRNGTICEGVPRVSDIDNLPIETAIAAQAWRDALPQAEYTHPLLRT